MFNEPSEQSRKLSASSAHRIDLASALKRDASKLANDADAMRQAEIDRIYDLLMQEAERWDGLS